jgi:hypothetical protein
MNRWQIVNGFNDLYNGPAWRNGSGKVRTIPDWGSAGGTISSIVYASGPNGPQFKVWSSPGQLVPVPQGQLNAALDSPATSDICYSLLQSIGTVAPFWSARDDHTLYTSADDVIFTTFGYGAGEAQRSYYETTIGRFGSANVFYGVSQSQVWPRRVPLPTPLEPGPSPPRPPERKRP